MFHESAAFFAPYLPHGATLLVVEGGCRYHAFSWFRGRPSALFAASPYPARPRVDDAEDAALLRELRAESVTGNPPLYLEQDGALFEVGVADVLPFALELYEDRVVPWQ